MMILHSDVTAERSSLVGAEMAHKLAVESNLDVRPCGFDLERVPLAQGFRRELGRGCQLVHGARHVQGTAGGIRVGIKSSVIDLDLIALINGQLPILCRVLITKRREAEKDSRVIE